MGRLSEKHFPILAPGVDCDRHGQQMKKRHKHPLEENALVRLSKTIESENQEEKDRNWDLSECFPFLFKQLGNDPSLEHVQVFWLYAIQDEDDGGTPI